MDIKKQPLVTILIPCFNAVPFLKEALESIINQTYSNLEILCINDGSTDETGNILEKYAKIDKRIRVIHNETNIRLIKTLNKGIELANGEYIGRMDADDIAAPNRIEIQLEFLRSHPSVDIVSCGLWVISERGTMINKVIPRQHTAVACFFASFFYVPIGHPELLAKANVFKENHFLEKDYALHTEDYELWSRLLSNGYNLQNIDTLLHYFRINSKSVSRMFTQIQDANFVACAQKHYLKYTNKNYSTQVVKIFVNRIDNLLAFADFKYALHEMQKFRIQFLQKEKTRIDAPSKREIQVVYFTQLLDICIQAIKRTSLKNKVYAFWILLANFQMLFYKGFWIYFKNKFH